MDAFVYGTLTEPERAAEVLDSYVYVGSATLFGLHLVEGRYPTLAPGGETGGRLLRTDELDALDAYESVETGLYRRVSVPLDAPGSHPDEAVVYVGDPDRLDADATWPKGVAADSADTGTAATNFGFAAGVDRYVEREGVRARLNAHDSV
jgi:gamma-glutamylcyclotransferase (GGCT)/AIG2-like uncharacterized protein YtfP